LVSSPRRTRTVVAVCMALPRLLARHGRRLLTEHRNQDWRPARRCLVDALTRQRRDLAFERRALQRLQQARNEFPCGPRANTARAPAGRDQEIERAPLTE